MEDHIKIPAEEANPEDHLLGGAEEAAGAGEDDEDARLDRVLRSLETFLRLLGFYQHPLPWFFFSWALFLLLGVSVPLLIFLLSNCSSSGGGGGGRSLIVEFDVCVMASQASLAAVSLLCVSHNLRKHGLRKLLFVGKSYEGLDRLHGQYVVRIKGFFRALFFWVLPAWPAICKSSILKTTGNYCNKILMSQYFWKSTPVCATIYQRLVIDSAYICCWSSSFLWLVNL